MSDNGEDEIKQKEQEREKLSCIKESVGSMTM